MRLNRARGASMGRVTDASPVSLHDVYRNHCGGRRVKVTRWAISYWRAVPTAAWEQDPKQHKFQGGSTPARGRQPGRTWNRNASRWPKELRET
jgi:hypothetical protein